MSSDLLKVNHSLFAAKHQKMGDSPLSFWQRCEFGRGPRKGQGNGFLSQEDPDLSTPVFTSHASTHEGNNTPFPVSGLTGSVEEGLSALQGQHGDKYLEGEDIILPGIPGWGPQVWLLCGSLGNTANDHEKAAQPWSHSLPMGPGKSASSFWNSES